MAAVKTAKRAKKPIPKNETDAQRKQRIERFNVGRQKHNELRQQAKAAGFKPSEDPRLKQAELAYASLITMARDDSSLFAELILRDEETGNIIENTPMHEEWHAKANSLNEYGTPQNIIIWAYPESGKSQQLAIARTLWLLGRNPRLRIAILAAAEKQAKKLIDSLRRHIENNSVLKLIFPNLKRGDLWQDNAITIERDGIIKDPSVQVLSPGGKVQGARIDVLVIDDVLVEDNTRTAYLREKTATWIRTSAFSRLAPNGQIVMLANAFHPEDMAHILAKEGGFWSKKYPVLLPDGSSAWPERWPMERIERKRTADGMGPTEFSRMYMCEPRNDGEARFKGEWIELCKARGEGWPLFNDLKAFINFVGKPYWLLRGVFWGDLKQMSWRNLPPGFITVTGVDLGVSRKDAADPTVVSTVLCWPDGTRHPLCIKRGKFSSPEIMQHVVDAHTKFHSIAIVEDNGAQDYLIQGLKQDYPDMPIRGFRTGTNKHKAYGVESVGSEMSEAKWLIPCIDGVVDPVVAVWLQEMLYYTAKGHTGDILMSMWMAREGIRAFHRVDDGDSGITVSSIG